MIDDVCQVWDLIMKKVVLYIPDVYSYLHVVYEMIKGLLHTHDRMVGFQERNQNFAREGLEKRKTLTSF